MSDNAGKKGESVDPAAELARASVYMYPTIHPDWRCGLDVMTEIRGWYADYPQITHGCLSDTLSSLGHPLSLFTLVRQHDETLAPLPFSSHFRGTLVQVATLVSYY